MDVPPKQNGVRKKTFGLTPNRAISMALAVCENYLKVKRKDETARTINFSDSHWQSFLECFYATHGRASPFFKDADITVRCRKVCDSLKIFCPQFDFDGQRNIWIVKPGSKSRGRGITCHENLASIMTRVMDPNNVDNRFVVQKYIERPLLIYNTKFDIRQWFLISDWQPLTIWWYKECYIRFCCREFTLDCFNEEIHLSNNAITQKYKNGKRSPLLPTENMWFLQDFLKYLESLGHSDVWERRVLPEMQKAIINSMLCSQDAIDVRKGCFELYGADYMISEDDLRPWLIEINASPCMAPSTSVTTTLTARVLEDALKVMIDRRVNRDCDVGDFIMIYKQKINLCGSFRREDCSKNNSIESSQSTSSNRPIKNGDSSSRQSADSLKSDKQRCCVCGDSKNPNNAVPGGQTRLPKKVYESKPTLRLRNPPIRQAPPPLTMKTSTISFDESSACKEKEGIPRRNGMVPVLKPYGKQVGGTRIRRQPPQVPTVTNKSY